jgi:hypothetical protein
MGGCIFFRLNIDILFHIFIVVFILPRFTCLPEVPETGLFLPGLATKYLFQY